MLTEEIIKPYLQRDMPKHGAYSETVDMHKDIAVHSKGEYSKDLLEVARPNEAEEYKQYRKDVFKPVTKTYFGKVLNTLGKIKRAEDWSVKFPEQSAPEGESLEEYTSKNYPFFDSFENWFFTIGIKKMIEDPNGVIAVFPMSETTADNEYRKPFTFIFPSDRVIEYKENELCVLESSEKSEVISGKDKVKEGRILYIMDPDSVWKVEQVGEKHDYKFEITKEWVINIQTKGQKFMPAIKLGGFILDFDGSNTIYESFLADCLHYWDEAMRRYSDHQVNMVLHLHPYEWEIADEECATCRGTGKVQEKIGKETIRGTCNSCNGQGKSTARTPFGRKLISPNMKEGVNNYSAIPTPPAGIVERDIGSISFLKKEYRDNIRDGLAALNLEFLMDEPELNSGRAKELDRQEMNAYFYSVARHIVENVFYPCYYFIAGWRYEGKLEDIVPSINVPRKYDLLTAEVVRGRVKDAQESNLNPTIQGRLQIDYAKKEFGEDAQEVQILETIRELDPLPNKTEEEKMLILANRGTTIEDYILSSMISSFVQRAISEDADFLIKNYKEKLTVLEKYVSEIASSTPKIPLVDESGAA